MNQLTIKRVALSDLHQDPANARAHPDVNLSAIEASLARFGQAEPLVVQAESGRVHRRQRTPKRHAEARVARM